MKAAAVRKKIQEYENFIEDKLKSDLKDIETILNEKTKKYNEWEEVKTVVKSVNNFKVKDRDIHVKVDIGNEVFATAEITDFNRTYIAIGLGYLLEMDGEEASKYSEIRMKFLRKEIEHYRNLAIDVKVHIKMVLLAVNELQATLG